jgi:predicted amidophosphoribosyltransferase
MLSFLFTCSLHKSRTAIAMTRCPVCANENPDTARYCMQCGRQLPSAAEPAAETRAGGFSAFTLSILASVAITLVLVFVFKLPIFFLAGFLPLLWWKKK